MGSGKFGKRVVKSIGALVFAASLAGCGAIAKDDSVEGTFVRQRQVDGLILLTHETSADSMQALLAGEVRANPAGCIAVGGTVVAFPDVDDLLGDGSLRRNGRTYQPGSMVRLAGGFAAAPIAIQSLSGVERYFIAGSGS